MALNKNHEYEELNGIRCGIVEKNAKPERVEFLKKILEYNRYEVIVVPTPAPKVAAPPPPKEGDPVVSASPVPPAPETFTVGVTDYTFNTINAIFGRMLKAPDGHIVTLAYWNQQEAVSNDEVPYYESN
jgi:hypothetical protein